MRIADGQLFWLFFSNVLFVWGGFIDCERESLAIHRPLVTVLSLSVDSLSQCPCQGPGGMLRCGGGWIIPGCHPAIGAIPGGIPGGGPPLVPHHHRGHVRRRWAAGRDRRRRPATTRGGSLRRRQPRAFHRAFAFALALLLGFHVARRSLNLHFRERPPGSGDRGSPGGPGEPARVPRDAPQARAAPCAAV